MTARGRQQVNRDPDRRMPPQPHPGFWELPAELPFDVCGRCACPVPATDKSRQRHLAWHEEVDGRRSA
jgi:hypothetical protein